MEREREGEREGEREREKEGEGENERERVYLCRRFKRGGRRVCREGGLCCGARVREN